MRVAIFTSLLFVLAGCRRDDEPYSWPAPVTREPLDVDVPPPYVDPPDAAAAVPPPPVPPPEVPAFAEGYLERQASGCWMTPAAPEPCPERAICTRPAITWSRVTCPPTLAKHDKKHVKPPKNMPPAPRRGYTEHVVATERCWHAPRVPTAACQGAKCNAAVTEVRCP